MPNLSDKVIAALAIPDGKREAWISDCDVKGLRLRATPGAKTFYCCWSDRATGERQRERLGAWGAITTEQARTAARIVLGKIAAGGDPAAERTARAAEATRLKVQAARAAADVSYTLDCLLTDWTELHLSTRRPRYAAEATRALRLAFKAYLVAPATALDYAMVLGVLDRLSAAGKGTTAALTLRYGSACYGWAVKRRRIALNPFAGLPMPERGGSRERVLNNIEIGEIWRSAGTMTAPYGQAVRLLLLTLARRDEVCGAPWGEMAPDLSAWTQSASRTKNRRSHIVHLSGPARGLLLDRLGAADGDPLPCPPAPGRLVFGVQRADELRPISGHSWVKREVDKAIAAARMQAAAEAGRAPEPMPAWVLHDFRRAGVTWLAGAGFAPHIADKLLNHTTGSISAIAGIYQRNEFLAERRAALDAWAAHVLTCADGRPSRESVVALATWRLHA